MTYNVLMETFNHTHSLSHPQLIPVLGSQSAGTEVTRQSAPLLLARSAVTFTAAEHHRPLADTKLYCLVTEARVYV